MINWAVPRRGKKSPRARTGYGCLTPCPVPARSPSGPPPYSSRRVPASAVRHPFITYKTTPRVSHTGNPSCTQLYTGDVRVYYTGCRPDVCGTAVCPPAAVKPDFGFIKHQIAQTPAGRMKTKCALFYLHSKRSLLSILQKRGRFFFFYYYCLTEIFVKPSKTSITYKTRVFPSDAGTFYPKRCSTRFPTLLISLTLSQYTIRSRWFAICSGPIPFQYSKHERHLLILRRGPFYH